MRRTFILHFLLSVSMYLMVFYFFGSQLTGLECMVVFASIGLIFWLLSYLFHRSYFHAFKGAINLGLYFLKELIIANVNMIYFILYPGHNFSPAILEFPLSLNSNFGITLLANLITLTPGTVTLEVSEDKKYLYFHTLNVPHQDLGKAKQKMKDGFEKRIMKITS